MDDSKTELFSTLFLHCEEKQTGTLFITNNDNHSCQIVLKEGEVISMALGLLKGDEVLSAIKLMEVTRFSFKKDLVLPMPAETQISSSIEVLQKLGYRKAKGNVPPKNTTTPKVKSNKPVVMYRGQVVQSAEPEEAEKPTPLPEVKSNKPLRMYRGQVVHG